MPSAGFFGHLGMFVAPHFIDAAGCASLRQELRLSPAVPATILDGKTNQLAIDEAQRKTLAAKVSAQTQSMVTQRLIALKPSLERHFAVELTGCEPVSFLRYEPGAYFVRHLDAAPRPQAPASFRQRRVSISVFLNGEGAAAEIDTYTGGALVFHRSPDPGYDAKHPGIALLGEEGLLVGFQSLWPHEVQPVRRGTRYSIVTWFY